MDVDEEPSSSTAVAKSDKKRFDVKKWNAVALWAWDIVVDNLLFVVTTSWICVLNARQIKQVTPVMNVQLPGEFATMPFISIVSLAG